MKKCVAVVLAIVIVFGVGMMNIISVYAEEKKEVLSGKITSKNPATMLQMHKDVTIIVDKKVGALINNN